MSYKKHFVSNDIAPSEMYEATAVDSGTDTISRAKAIEALDEQIEQCNKSLSSFDISMKDEYAVKSGKSVACGI